MPSHSSITSADLLARLGLPDAPVLIDVRIDEDFAADPRLVPGSQRCAFADSAALAALARGRPSVVICHRGLKLSEGAAALLRLSGTSALALQGGFVGWQEAGLPLVPASEIPSRGRDGATLWVTRERPKIDRIACPWLIRRFIDPEARFLFVRPSEVLAVAEKFGATPFDVEGVRWSHVGPECTFDTMVKAWGLSSPTLDRLATIVRGANTADLAAAPQAAGLLAISLGLSHMFADDLAQLEAGLLIYDALYRWCRDGVAETHNWPARRGGGQ